MRPFEVGDFVKVSIVGWDYVRKFDNKRLFLMSGGFVLHDDIKTIRKPRTGGAESRAIVAMLARYGRRSHNLRISQMRREMADYYEHDFKRFKHDRFTLSERMQHRQSEISAEYKNRKFYSELMYYRQAKSMIDEPQKNADN